MVETLRVAAGDGRLTPAELDERLELALAARTVRELAPLTVDLSPTSAVSGEESAVKDMVRIHQRHSGAVTRAGRWTVPRRMELRVDWCEVTLDFTEAVFVEDTLRIDVAMKGKTLTLLTRPGLAVDTDELQLSHTKVVHRPSSTPEVPVTHRVRLVGHKAHGRLVVKPPRTPLGARLRGRRGAPPARG